MPIESQPLTVGCPAAQSSLSLFLIIAAPSEDDLGELGVEVVADALGAALAAHAASTSMPPNGASAAASAKLLIPTMPAFSAATVARARARGCG